MPEIAQSQNPQEVFADVLGHLCGELSALVVDVTRIMDRTDAITVEMSTNERLYNDSIHRAKAELGLLREQAINLVDQIRHCASEIQTAERYYHETIRPPPPELEG